MNQIRMVKDDNGEIFLSQKDLLAMMNERLERFPDELAQLKKPKEGKIVGINGAKSATPPDEKEIAKHEGMEAMLRGIVNTIKTEEEK